MSFHAVSERPVFVSIALFAHNEDFRVARALEALFQQTIFRELHARGRQTEILCFLGGNRGDIVAASIAAQCDGFLESSPYRDSISTRIITDSSTEKVSPWNAFVHHQSASEARYLVMMSPSVLPGESETLWNLCLALVNDLQAELSVGDEVEHGSFGMATGRAARSRVLSGRLDTEDRFEGLYCIRAETARRIWIPRQLPACESMLVKALVCTDFGAHETEPARITVADNATYRYRGPEEQAGALLASQRRRMVGRTYAHVFMEHFLSHLAPPDRVNIKAVVPCLDRDDPGWLRALVREHLRHTRRFWRLLPDLPFLRLKRLARLPAREWLRGFPMAIIDCALSMVAARSAMRAMQAGIIELWTDKREYGARRLGDSGIHVGSGGSARPLSSG